jgi:hypothetical protein
MGLSSNIFDRGGERGKEQCEGTLATGATCLKTPTTWNGPTGLHLCRGCNARAVQANREYHELRLKERLGAPTRREPKMHFGRPSRPRREGRGVDGEGQTGP